MPINTERRRFLKQAAGFSSAAAALAGAPAIAASEPYCPPASDLPDFSRADVRINYNEYPLSVVESARDALVSILGQTNRYRFDLQQQFTGRLAEHLGVHAEHLLLYPGSSWALLFMPELFTGPDRALVMAEPGYEACAQVCQRTGAPVHRVPLAADGSHDTNAMAGFDDAGLIYVVNPNNPTGTVTPRKAIEKLLADKPKDAVLLVDEAYIHFSDERSMAGLVADHPDLVVLQTFSKIYGMAGLRCGFAVASGETKDRLASRSAGAAFLPNTAIVAADASIADADLVPSRKAYTAGIRRDTIAWLKAQGVPCTDSRSNCFMMNVGQPGKEIAKALAEEGVLVGRSWAAWPNWIRVSIGTPKEMDAFKQAFARVWQKLGDGSESG
ncbi:aminotransferase class I/II-fold pyridoxal phosphate-dependent enzyme [Salinisphaera sp. SPP-AMP-43]|uniref:aminotransferase class I/II-fold pyridoxal phosphate-dependent enzyme n=1 Tax=Salinisphaera sp. SPP-AMP-43 TaxID=3121288 RepID=UPI003C6E80A4